jgi:hypothetical protein
LQSIDGVAINGQREKQNTAFNQSSGTLVKSKLVIRLGFYLRLPVDKSA